MKIFSVIESKYPVSIELLWDYVRISNFLLFFFPQITSFCCCAEECDFIKVNNYKDYRNMSYWFKKLNSKNKKQKIREKHAPVIEECLTCFWLEEPMIFLCN